MATTTYSAISDLRAQEVMSAEYFRLLAAREALPNHPAISGGFAGSVNGAGSASIKLGHYGFDGYDLTASTGDGSDVSSTTFSDGETTVTAARYSLRYDLTDLARLTDPSGMFSPVRFAQSIFGSAQQNLVNLVAALLGSFSNTVGTSGSDATLQNFLDAKRQLAVSDAPGEAIAVLHPVQWADVMDDLALNAGGGIVFTPATDELIRVRGNGYQGQLAGVDVWTTTRVPTANAAADRAGGMFTRSAIAWCTGTAPVDFPDRQVQIGDIVVDFERDASKGLTEIVGHQYVGVAEGIDAAGVAIITDA